MNRTLLAGTALCAALALPAIAEAASGFATANVNMRSGPSTAYPAVTLIPVGQPLRINGCLQETPWCDVSFAGGRGWVAGQYIQVTYQQRRIYVGPQYYRPLGIPTVVFDLDNYWDRNYRGRDFYRDRDRWARNPRWDGDNGDPNQGRRRPPPPPPPGYDGSDDGNQGNWPRRGNWPRQQGYDQPGYNNDYGQQDDNNPPRPPRYRQPDNNGQRFDGNRQPQGNFGNDGDQQRPPRQQGRQDQGQPPPPPPGQMQPQPDQQQQQRPPRQPQAQQPQQPQPQQAQPQPAPPPRQPREQQQNQQPQSNAQQNNGCLNMDTGCGKQHFSHN